MLGIYDINAALVFGEMYGLSARHSYVSAVFQYCGSFIWLVISPSGAVSVAT